MSKARQTDDMMSKADTRLDNIQRRIALLRQCLQATVEGDHDRADALLEAMDRVLAGK